MEGFAIANGAITLGTILSKLKNVDNDLETCLSLLSPMKHDLNVARRLRNSKYPQRDHKPMIQDSPLDYANTAIKDLKVAVHDLYKSIDDVRVNKLVDNSISVKNRIMWAFVGGKDNFLMQQGGLIAKHHRVVSVIATLQLLPDGQVETSNPPPPYESAVLMSSTGALKGKSTAIVGHGKGQSIGMWCASSSSMTASYTCYRYRLGALFLHPTTAVPSKFIPLAVYIVTPTS